MISAGAMPRFSRNEIGRDFAVGDIHGCFEHLSRSLKAIDFDEGVDRLFSVGDLVDAQTKVFCAMSTPTNSKGSVGVCSKEAPVISHPCNMRSSFG